MKKLLLFSLSSLLLIAPALMTGCAGTPKAAYKTLKSVADSVDVAMKAYADSVVAGEISLEAQAQVKRLHDQYRTTFSKAVLAAQFDYEAAAPSEVSELAAELVSHVASFVH